MTAADVRDDGTASFAGFARLMGCRRSYVTELKAAGRLVLTEDGKRVRVAESRQLIADTKDPARAAVAARHAATRLQQGAGEGAATPAPDAPDDADQGPTGDPVADSHARRKAKALADKEEALARKALRDEQLELGQLLRADDVAEAVRAAGVVLRTALENLPSRLAPELAAATDEGRVRVLLGDALEHALHEVSRKFGDIGRQVAGQ
jgi:hypothetical protein